MIYFSVSHLFSCLCGIYFKMCFFIYYYNRHMYLEINSFKKHNYESKVSVFVQDLYCCVYKICD